MRNESGFGQPVDYLAAFSYGKHTVTGDQVRLSPEGRGLAEECLEKTPTYMLSVSAVQAFKDTLVPHQSNIGEREIVEKIRELYATDSNRLAAFENVRLIRNAFAHQPYQRRWDIANALQGTTLRVTDLIELDTTGKDGNELQWQDYGGLLALWQLSQWIRVNVLDDLSHPAKLIRPE